MQVSFLELVKRSALAPYFPATPNQTCWNPAGCFSAGAAAFQLVPLTAHAAGAAAFQRIPRPMQLQQVPLLFSGSHCPCSGCSCFSVVDAAFQWVLLLFSGLHCPCSGSCCFSAGSHCLNSRLPLPKQRVPLLLLQVLKIIQFQPSPPLRSFTSSRSTPKENSSLSTIFLFLQEMSRCIVLCRNLYWPNRFGSCQNVVKMF